MAKLLLWMSRVYLLGKCVTEKGVESGRKWRNEKDGRGWTKWQEPAVRCTCYICQVYGIALLALVISIRGYMQHILILWLYAGHVLYSLEGCDGTLLYLRNTESLTCGGYLGINLDIQN